MKFYEVRRSFAKEGISLIINTFTNGLVAYMEAKKLSKKEGDVFVLEVKKSVYASFKHGKEIK